MRYDILKNHQKQVQKVFKDVSGEGTVILKRVTSPITSAFDFFSQQKDKKCIRPQLASSEGSPAPGNLQDPLELTDTYTSPLANADRTITCPNSEKYGCKDLWVPDLFGEWSL
jgi:acetyl-CoA carboxylase carboxyl transferase subunit beta